MSIEMAGTFCTIISEKLSDGSEVFNVVVQDRDAFNSVSLNATDSNHALALFNLIELCVGSS